MTGSFKEQIAEALWDGTSSHMFWGGRPFVDLNEAVELVEAAIRATAQNGVGEHIYEPVRDAFVREAESTGLRALKERTDWHSW